MRENITLSIIIRGTFGSHISGLVEILTRQSGETYNEYIEIVSRYPEALQIKWIDIIDNTSYSIPPTQRKKYRDACIHLRTLGVAIPSILIQRLDL